MKKSLSITAAAVAALVSIGTLAGCATPTTEKPTTSPSATSEKPKPTESQKPNEMKESADVKKYTADELKTANQILEDTKGDKAFSPLASGGYVTVEGSTIFKGLTKFIREDGTELFFATSGDAPFGSAEAGVTVPASPETRSATIIGSKIGEDDVSSEEAVRVRVDMQDKF